MGSADTVKGNLRLIATLRYEDFPDQIRPNQRYYCHLAFSNSCLSAKLILTLNGESQNVVISIQFIGGSFSTPRPIASLHNFQGRLPLLPKLLDLASERQPHVASEILSRVPNRVSICRTFWKNSLRGWNNLHRVYLRLSLNFSTVIVQTSHVRHRLGKHGQQLLPRTAVPCSTSH